MEPTWTSGVYPGGGCADWAVSRKQGVGYNMTATKDSLEGAEGLSKLFMP
jgi:hypothetical protein